MSLLFGKADLLPQYPSQSDPESMRAVFFPGSARLRRRFKQARIDEPYDDNVRHNLAAKIEAEALEARDANNETTHCHDMIRKSESLPFWHFTSWQSAC